MSATERQQPLGTIKKQYDVAVVGGGIYGAATAWEAASRGLNVILIEAEDFCSGTSANSLKTIHVASGAFSVSIFRKCGSISVSVARCYALRRTL